MRFFKVPFKKQPEEVESKIALAEAQHARKKIQDRSPAVTEVATSLRVLRDRNHFAEQLESIMGGSK